MLQTAINLQIKQQALNKQKVFDVVALPPKGFAQIIIGIYESIIPPPTLQAHITPKTADDEVDILPAKIDENGDYTLICLVRNHSKQACIVSIGAADERSASVY